MDDSLRIPFKKRYEYKEHSSYLSFQLNDVLVIQNQEPMSREGRRRIDFNNISQLKSFIYFSGSGFRIPDSGFSAFPYAKNNT